MIEPISQHLLERARRAATKRIAACCILCMADTDATFATIANRIGKKEDALRGWLHGLIDGTENSSDMNKFSDFLLAMGAEPVFSVQPCSFLNDPTPEQAAA